MGLPGGTSGKEPSCHGRKQRFRFDLWVRKIPWSRAWQPNPVFLPGRITMDRESWWTIVHGIAKSQTWLNDWAQSALAKEVGSWVNYFLNKSKHFMLTLISEVINQGKIPFSYLHPFYPHTWKCTHVCSLTTGNTEKVLFGNSWKKLCWVCIGSCNSECMLGPSALTTPC